MKILSLAFLLIGLTTLIYFSLGTTTTLINSANETLNTTNNTALTQSFDTAVNVTVSTFTILGFLPMLIAVIMVILVLFGFVALTR